MSERGPRWSRWTKLSNTKPSFLRHGARKLHGGTAESELDPISERYVEHFGPTLQPFDVHCSPKMDTEQRQRSQVYWELCPRFDGPGETI